MVDILLWIGMRIVWVAAPLEEVCRRSYLPQPTPNYSIDKEQAKILFDVSESASAHTDDKIKQLLTVSSSLATFVAVFGHDARPHILGICVVALLVAAVLLCLSAFEVRRLMVPTVENAEGVDRDVSWGRDLLSSCYANTASHFFRVDQYRAASRYFVLALLCTVALAAFRRTTDPVGELTAIARRIEQYGMTTHPMLKGVMPDTLLVRVTPAVISIKKRLAGATSMEAGAGDFQPPIHRKRSTPNTECRQPAVP